MMHVEVSKDKLISRWVDRENLIMLDEIELEKPCIKMKKVINRGKKSKALSEVKPGENISKNMQSLVEISLLQMEVLLSRKLQDHVYEY